MVKDKDTSVKIHDKATNVMTIGFCLQLPYFAADYPRLGQVPERPPKEREPLGIAEARLLQAGYPSRYPTNNVNALKRKNKKKHDRRVT